MSEPYSATPGWDRQAVGLDKYKYYKITENRIRAEQNSGFRYRY